MLHVPSLLLLLLLLASYSLPLLPLLFLHFSPLLPFLLLTLKTTRGQCWDQGLLAEQLAWDWRDLNIFSCIN
jgi:hypothetical protein